jgi:hypothetical protein
MRRAKDPNTPDAAKSFAVPANFLDVVFNDQNTMHSPKRDAMRS